MKTIAISEYGHSIGIRGARLVVKEKGEVILEQALSRVKSVLIAKGASISSNCILELTVRGIKLFVTDFKGEIVSCLYNTNNHGSVHIRKNQFKYIASTLAQELAAEFIIGKIKNQRAVLKYYAKYKSEHTHHVSGIMQTTAQSLESLQKRVKGIDWKTEGNWRNRLLGFEGIAAAQYWQTLAQSQYFPEDFRGRTGRHAKDIVNKAINYGYAILSTVLMNALINAGLELYAGIIHSDVPGKPSLLLDVMEEYRPFVVDRAIIKIRHIFFNHTELSASIKKRIISEIYANLQKKYLYNKRKIMLESIIQRQMYKLAGVFCGTKNYRSISFKW